MEKPATSGYYLMKAILLVTLVFLSGCAEYRALIAVNGAESADATLESAEWGVCKLSSSGSLERRYHLFTDPKGPRAAGWVNLCHGVQ